MLNTNKEFSKLLVDKYRVDLFSMLRVSNSESLMPFIDTESNIKDKAMFKEMMFSFLKHLSILEKPIYLSRQDFLKYAFLDDNGQLCFHLENLGEYSTLMGGSKDEDPYYDPNWKGLVFKYNDKEYARIRKNLTSRFFYGKNTEYYAFSESNNYIKSISLKDVSIEEFENLFTPKLNEWSDEAIVDFFESKAEDFEEFFNKIVITEKLKPAESRENMKPQQSYEDIANRFQKLYVDENDKEINGEPFNASFTSRIEVGDILTFNKGVRRVVTEIELHPSPIKKFYVKVKTKIKEYDKKDFIGI